MLINMFTSSNQIKQNVGPRYSHQVSEFQQLYLKVVVVSPTKE